MAGNKIGGQKAAKKNLAKDRNFYRRIGKLGGLSSGHDKYSPTPKGFAANPEVAARAGRIGGQISRRPKR